MTPSPLNHTTQLRFNPVKKHKSLLFWGVLISADFLGVAPKADIPDILGLWLIYCILSVFFFCFFFFSSFFCDGGKHKMLLPSQYNRKIQSIQPLPLGLKGYPLAPTPTPGLKRCRNYKEVHMIRFLT